MDHLNKFLKINENVMGVFDKYESFILENVSQVNAIENGLRTLTYILPGRFSDAEVASEALYSLLNLVGLYHDKILTKLKIKYQQDGMQPSLFNKYTRTLISSSPLYKQCAYALSFIEYTEVLLEMLFIKKYGQKGKWKLISFIELFKMLLRLTIFKLSSNRTLLSPPHPERERPPIEDPLQGPLPNPSWQGSRTGYSHPKLDSVILEGQRSDFQRFLVSKVLDKDTARKAEDLVTKLSGLGKYGEWLYIIRPLIYVLAIRRYGIKSWKPWLLSFALEYSSRVLKTNFVEKHGGVDALSSLEQEEQRRRLYLLRYYLLKAPVFDKFTKPILQGFCAKTKDRLLLSFFSGMLQDYIPLWEKFHFYTSGSG